MEKLIYVAITGAIVAAIVLGFLAGAVANLFGGHFWVAAVITALMTVMFFAGKLTR